MKILGLNAFGQNPSACLVIDGRLVGFSHEERFTRLKCSHYLFPSLTIKWLLSSNKLKISDIDVIAFNWDCTKYPFRRLGQLLLSRLSLGIKSIFSKKHSGSENYYQVLQYLLTYSPQNMIRRIRDELRYFGHGGKLPKIEFVGHHISHLYQSYYSSPFDEAIALVVDGHGEENCVSGYLIKNGNFKKIISYDVPNSLGWFYASITAYLGFHPNRDEGKLMGLAAYGEERKEKNIWLEKFNEIITVDENGFNINPFYIKIGKKDFHPNFTNKLVEFFTSVNKDLEPIGVGETILRNGIRINKYLLDEYVDIAYAAQFKLEEALCSVVNKMIKETNVRNLCYSGGVAMNCKANRAIYDNCGINEIFIHPAAGDDGSAIGAAFYIAHQVGELVREPLLHTQYGVSFSLDEIKKILDNCNLKYETPDDVCAVAAKYIDEGKIIGWFSGAAEMGARALGGRSIVANPFLREIKNKINTNVKYRESWRPYCPSLLRYYKSKCLENPVESPFMIISSKGTDWLKSTAPDIVHIDNTVRPQTVDNNVLPKWAHLIEEFGKLSGHPIVLNTSFNVRGEPIVNTPYDAIRTFYSTGLDVLVLEDFVLKK